MMTRSHPERKRHRPATVKRGTTPSPAGHDSFPIIAMAASVGGLKALSVILGSLPANFPAAIAIVMHLAPDHKSVLAEILNARSDLEVRQAKTGDFLCRSCVFVAPPNHHLLVGRSGGLKLSDSTAEKINFARPSAEPLFVSVAKVFKAQAIAVVLTGGDGDGSFGVQIIKDEGGLVIAQDRPTSENFSMPETSIETGDVDYVLPLEQIGPKLIELVARGTGRGTTAPSVRPMPSQRAKPAGRRGLKRPSGLITTHISDVRSSIPKRFKQAEKNVGIVRRAPDRRDQSPRTATPRYPARTKPAMVTRKS